MKKQETIPKVISLILMAPSENDFEGYPTNNFQRIIITMSKQHKEDVNAL